MGKKPRTQNFTQHDPDSLKKKYHLYKKLLRKEIYNVSRNMDAFYIVPHSFLDFQDFLQ